MAKKKPVIDDLFKRTTDQPQPAKADPITARGVGLKLSEWQEIETLAEGLNMTPHALAVYLLRYGMTDLRAGKIKTKTTTTLE